MKKLVLLAGVGLLTLGSVNTAEAQRWRRHHGGWNNGGAIAAGLVGGAILGGLVSAAASPAYAYPGYSYPSYSYPAYGYNYGYRYPAAYSYPAYSYGYGYGGGSPYYSDPYYAAPVRTRVVYRSAPVYRERVVYRAPRVVYQQPRYRTRTVYRQDFERGRVVRAVRRDVVTTGAIRHRDAVRVNYRRLRDY